MTDLSEAIAVIKAEAAAVQALIEHLDEQFEHVVELGLKCEGRLALSGMGKAGLIAEKISATLASTGTPSFFLHPAEAVHGDLGRLRREDLILALSNSGETAEMLRLVDPVKALGSGLVAMTGAPESTMARYADHHLSIGKPDEAGPMGLAPTSSTTAMLVLGDALAMSILKRRDFGPRDYARFHPGGSLGAKLMTVAEIMRKGDRNPVVLESASVHETLKAINHTSGRPGAASVVDGRQMLVGFITDGDIVRALENGADFLSRPIVDIMAKSPKSVHPHQLASEAARILRDKHIDQLAVVDDTGRAVGLVDIQDLVAAGVRG
ncbi:MAG: KpsF/GutQ family sugar-phosphate isomerase [Planctomycetota bacterium]